MPSDFSEKHKLELPKPMFELVKSKKWCKFKILIQ